VITSDRKIWVDTMMIDELRIMEDEGENPIKHGLATVAAFFLAGIVPLLAYVIPGVPNTFWVAVVLGMVSLFIVGALRSLVTAVTWLRGGLEMLFVGSGAAMVAFIVGNLVEKIVSQ